MQVPKVYIGNSLLQYTSNINRVKASTVLDEVLWQYTVPKRAFFVCQQKNLQ